MGFLADISSSVGCFWHLACLADSRYTNERMVHDALASARVLTDGDGVSNANGEKER